MKVMIKLFEQYNEYSQVKEWLDKMGVKKYTINDDLTVDVNSSVNLFRYKLTEIPIQFGKVNDHFICSNNQLTTLKGCPFYVGGTFDCGMNNLSSLEYCPVEVGIIFDCSSNNITSLKDGPVKVGSLFNCNDNKLTSLQGCSTKVGKDFYILKNPLPIEILDFKYIKYIIENQDDYGIWNTDGSFNNARFDILFKEYSEYPNVK